MSRSTGHTTHAPTTSSAMSGAPKRAKRNRGGDSLTYRLLAETPYLNASSVRMRRRGSVNILVDAKIIAFRILEPGGLLGAEHANMIDGFQPWKIIIFKYDASRLQRFDLRRDVTHFEADRRVVGLGPALFWKQGKRSAAAPDLIDKLSVRFCAERLQ